MQQYKGEPYAREELKLGPYKAKSLISCGDKWRLGRDFNIVQFSSEKMGGGGARMTRSMKDFNTFINDTGLRDFSINMQNLDGQMGGLDQGQIDSCSYRSGKTWSLRLDNKFQQESNRTMFLSHWIQVHSSGSHLLLDSKTRQSLKEFLGCFKNWWEKNDVQGQEGFKFMKKLENVKR